MKMSLRLCTKCGKSKTEDCFYKRKSKSEALMSKCKECTTTASMIKYAETCEEKRAAMRAYYANNKATISAARKVRRESDLEVKIKHLLRNAEQRAKEKGFDFNLTFDFVLKMFEKQEGLCFYTGTPLELKGENRLSIDRKNPSKGYTEDNINLVCLRVNYMKRDIQHDAFIDFCKIVGGKF